MNKRHLTLTSLLIASGIALALPLSAAARPDRGPGGCDGYTMMQPGPGMMQPGPGMMQHGPSIPHGGMHRMLRGLDLSEAQRDKVFEILHAQAPLMRDKAKILRNTRNELRALAQSPQFDAQRAKELADAGATAMSEMAQLRARTGNQIFNLLTPEQRQKLHVRMDRFNRPGHADGFHGHGWGG